MHRFGVSLDEFVEPRAYWVKLVQGRGMSPSRNGDLEHERIAEGVVSGTFVWGLWGYIERCKDGEEKISECGSESSVVHSHQRGR